MTEDTWTRNTRWGDVIRQWQNRREAERVSTAELVDSRSSELSRGASTSRIPKRNAGKRRP